MRLLEDPTRIELNGKPVLLMHGDTLCTDDVAYQQFRAQTRDPAWQAQFLSQPLAARLAFAQQARAASQARQGELREAGTMEAITDVSPAAVDAAFAEHGVDTIIHGHTRSEEHTSELQSLMRISYAVFCLKKKKKKKNTE